METMTDAIPPGFVPHKRHSPLTAPWEPLYAHVLPDTFHLGFRAREAHTNSRRFVHGGLISALADNAMGLACGLHLDKDATAGLVTVNLALDFIASGAIGQWIEIRPAVIRASSSLCFATALILADETICARANGTFKALQRKPAPARAA